MSKSRPDLPDVSEARFWCKNNVLGVAEANSDVASNFIFTHRWQNCPIKSRDMMVSKLSQKPPWISQFSYLPHKAP